MLNSTRLRGFPLTLGLSSQGLETYAGDQVEKGPYAEFRETTQ